MNNENKPTGIGALAQRAIICHVQVDRAETALEELKKNLKGAKDVIEGALAEQGLTSIKYQGWTVYAQQQVFAQLLAHEDDKEKKSVAMQALKDTGLGWMVKENVAAATLRSWVNEQKTDDETNMPKLPETLKAHVKLSSKTDIRIKRS